MTDVRGVGATHLVGEVRVGPGQQQAPHHLQVSALRSQVQRAHPTLKQTDTQGWVTRCASGCEVVAENRWRLKYRKLGEKRSRSSHGVVEFLWKLVAHGL